MKKYIVSTKRMKGKGKGRISRLMVDPNNPTILHESFAKSGDFTIDHTWNVPLTHLLDEGACMLLKKSDADKVKRHTGKTYEFVRVAEYEKTLAKRAKTRKKSKEAEERRISRSIEHWSKEPEERDELDSFFAIPEAQLDPKALADARAARLEAKHKADSTIIRTEPKGENQEYEIKTASGVVICTHRTVDLTKEDTSEVPEAVRKRPSLPIAQRVILPYTHEEIPVPDDLQLAPKLILLRQHKQTLHRVTVTNDLKFFYRGTDYKTLTEISWKAAGYQISGNAFFGLPAKKRS